MDTITILGEESVFLNQPLKDLLHQRTDKKKLEVRKAVIDDIPQIHAITIEAFEQYRKIVGGTKPLAALTETEEDIANDIQTKEVFVALLNDIIVGSVRIEIRSDKTAYLSRFGVHPDFQSQGVGKALLSRVDDAMVEQSVKRIYLHTAAKATNLICAYYKRGYYIDSTSKDRGYIRALLCKEYESENAEVEA